MKKTIVCLLALCLLFSGCASRETAQPPETPTEPIPVHSKGQIWLYGENHSDPKCLKKELEIWGTFYAEGMRDLFIEMPFYTAELLNEWMH